MNLEKDKAKFVDAVMKLGKTKGWKIKQYGNDAIEIYESLNESHIQYKDLYKEAKRLFKGKVKGNSKAFSIPYKYGIVNIYDGRGEKADVSWESGGSTQDTESKSYEEVLKMINYYWTSQMESLNEADDKEQKSTDRSPLDSAEIEKALKTKAEESKAPIGIIRAVMRRGLAAWKSGHRPGAGQIQWGYARVNSFLTGGDGTWGKADKDLATEARKAGFNPKK